MPAQSGSPRLILLLLVLATCVPLSISACLPSLPSIAGALGVSAGWAQMSMAALLAGLCVGTLLSAPLAARHGLRALLLSGIGLYGLASVACLLADHAVLLLLGRLFQGLGAAAVLVMGRTLVAEVFAPGQGRRVSSQLLLIALCAALLAPVLVTWLSADWRAVFAVAALLAALAWLATWRVLDRSPVAVPGGAVFGPACTAWLQVLSNRQAASLLLCMGFACGGLFAFITAAPFVFIRGLGFSTWAFIAVMALNLLAIVLVCAIDSRNLGRGGSLAALKLGAWGAAAAGLGLTAASLLGWAAAALLIVCTLLFVGVSALIVVQCMASLKALFADADAPATTVALALQFAAATAFSWMVSAFADGSAAPMCVALGIAGAGSLLGFWGISEEQAQGEPAGQ